MNDDAMPQRPPSYWEHFPNVKAAILRIAQMNRSPDDMPTPTELANASEGGLANAIAKRHGGYPKVARRLGLRLRYTPKGYWMDFENVQHELSRYLADHEDEGVMPTSKQLNRAGFSGVANAIVKCHRGFPAVARQLGLTLPYKPKGYWYDFENIKHEILLFASQQDDPEIMPSEDQLRDAEISSLAFAIQRAGGFPHVAKSIGLLPRRKPNRYWENFKNLRSELSEWIVNFGTAGVMPTAMQLRNAERHDLSSAIGSHGGFPAVMLRIGLKPLYPSRPMRYWLNPENCDQEIREWIELYGTAGKMPTANELMATDRSSLTFAICVYHGGFSRVAARLGLKTARRANNYWDDKAVDEEILKFVLEHGTAGEMPTDGELREHGRHDIANGIYRGEGGVRDVAARLDLTFRGSKPDGYWDDPETLDQELLEFIKDYGTPGFVPTQRELNDAGRGDLAAAISSMTGGQFGTAERLNLRAQRVPKGYWDDIENINTRVTAFNRLRGIEGVMPTRDELLSAEETTLASAIEKNGGYPLLAQKLGLDTPSCGLGQHSRTEIVLSHELKSLFDFDVDDHVIETPDKVWKVDIKIPTLSLVVEYDSAYYHTGREHVDRRKSDSLTNAGWRVIRCREHPLGELSPYGVIVPNQKMLKEVANLLLARIEESCMFRIDGLTNYLACSNLVNVAEAQSYITQLRERIRTG